MRVLLFVFVSLLPIAAEKLDGLWVGTVKADQVALRLVLHVNRSPGDLVGTLDIIDQGLAGLPLKSVVQDGESVKFALTRIAASFEGTLGKNEITGSWMQANLSIPVVFKRTDRLPEIARPQDPKKPYPYREEEVTYVNTKACIRFAGTLTLPHGAGPHPAVLLIGGAGGLDRNGSLFGHKPLLVLADHLTRKGVAVLRVDGRGVGGSDGKMNEGAMADFVADTLAGITFLKSRGEIDPKRIGVTGSSEGGLIATQAAKQCTDIGLLVLMATPGVPGEQLVEAQAERILNSLHVSAEMMASNRALQRAAFDILGREKDTEAAFRKIHEAAAGIRYGDRLLPLLEAQLKVGDSPWSRELLTYDPRLALATLKIPVLAIHGERDLDVPLAQNLTAISECLKSGGNSDHTIVSFPGLNHLFQADQKGERSEYAKIEETMAPAALEIVGDWTASHTHLRQ